MRHFLITADFTNGNVNGHQLCELNENMARLIADRMHNDPGYMNVQLTEPMGVLLTYSNQSTTFESCDDINVGLDTVESWKAVIANRRINRTRVRKAELIGVPSRSSVPTEEDIKMGEWLCAALDDRKVSPCMKLDINRWMDSKEWP